jgi:catechol 2,3-dioxygenase-like lactoylglutathione lyase family enzyme
MKINHLNLSVPDVPQTARFFAEFFGLHLPEQISSIGLLAVTESQCTEDEHDDEDEDDSKFRNLGLIVLTGRVSRSSAPNKEEA